MRTKEAAAAIGNGSPPAGHRRRVVHLPGAGGALPALVAAILATLLGLAVHPAPARAEQPLIVRPPAVRVGPDSGLHRPGVIRPTPPRTELYQVVPRHAYEAPTYRYEAPQAIPDRPLDRRLPGSPKLGARCRPGFAAYDPATGTTLDETGQRVPCP